MGVQIPGYPHYFVNEDGSVYSLYSKKYLKQSCNSHGYLSVELYEGKKRKRIFVHRLVAQTFLPNPFNLPQVNHKDENPSNNHINNLEWCDAKYNMNYGLGAKTRHLKIDYSKPIYKINAIKNGKKASKPVLMLTKEGIVIREFESGAEAERLTGTKRKYISAVIHGKAKSANGYIWKLKERGDDL